MGRTTRHQRKGRGGIFKGITRTRLGAAKLRKYDFSERHGFVKGVVKSIEHDPGRGAPLARVEFRDQYKFRKNHELFIVPEGVYSGQFLACVCRPETRCRSPATLAPPSDSLLEEVVWTSPCSRLETPTTSSR